MRLLLIFFILIGENWAIDYKWEAPLSVLSSEVSALSTDVSNLSTNPSKWSTNGTSIYYNGGKVGIGTASPASKLDVLSTSSSVLGYGNAVGFEDASTWYQSLAFYLNNASGIWGGKPSAFIGVGNSTARLLMSAGAQIGGNDSLANWAIPSATTASFLSLAGEDLIFFGNTGLTPPFSYTPTERFRIDGATGNVGIGTGGPTTKLVVNDGTDNNLEFGDDGTSMVMAAINDARSAYISQRLIGDPIIFAGLNNSEYMRIISGGNVGIGTASPSTNLKVKQSADASNTYDLATVGITIEDVTDDSVLQIFGTAGAWNINSNYYATGYDRDMLFHTTRSSTPDLAITTGHNVGIGTSSPGALQPGTKGLTIYDASAAGLTLGNASNWFTWYLSSTSLKLYSGGGTPVDNIFVVDNTGKVGIRTSSPVATLHVTGTAQVNHAYSGVYVETGISVVNQSTGNSPSIDLINDTQSETINIMNNSGVFTVSRGGVSGVSFGDVLFLVSDNGIRLDTQTNIPTAKTDPCTPKTTTWDANYMYYCEYSGNWKRIAWDNSTW